MPQFKPDVDLKAIITAEAAARFNAGDAIDFDGRQYQVLRKDLLTTGNYEIHIKPTGQDANFVPPAD